MKRKFFIKRSFLVLLLLIGLVSCDQKEKNNQSKQSKQPTAITKLNTEEEKTVVKHDPHAITIAIEQISSNQFYSAMQYKKVSKPIEKITDLTIVQKQLSGIVDFRKKGDSTLYINKIHFRNGTILENDGECNYCSFVAYFPTDDILLLEGGHMSDVSFDLGTGQETEDAGNPELATESPNSKYRLNKIYEGQECYEHFIQKKQNGKFQKIVDLNKLFKDKTGEWLCYIEKEFWTDDTTLYFGLVTEYKETGNEYVFYKVKIIER
ncbi:hypothetical protein [Flavobacterium sp.]|uniref:hypothetical protein n=1 Tax=Flavobacterium sp. TaxID=239 RepID=UPI00262B6A11|nr:hypothetical protein [Flavobacterium sp.]